MKKIAYVVILLSLLLLIACTGDKKDIVMEALRAEGLEVSQTDEFYYPMKVDGKDPTRYYDLGRDMKINVYDFGSSEKQESGFKDFKKQRESFNMADPPVIQANKYLVITSPQVTEEFQIKIQ